MILGKEKWTNLLEESHYYYLIEDFIMKDYKKHLKVDQWVLSTLM